MKAILFVAGLLLLLNSASSATSEKPSSNKTISVCPVEYTALGKTARWHFNFTYLLNTDADGTVQKLAKLETDNKGARFVNERVIIECVKTWKLLPQGQHVVLFSMGTTGDGNYISIVDSDRSVIKIMLP